MKTAEDVELSEAQIAVHWREEEYFYPPAKFIGQANASDPSIFERFREENFPECFKEYADLLTCRSECALARGSASSTPRCSVAAAAQPAVVEWLTQGAGSSSPWTATTGMGSSSTTRSRRKRPSPPRRRTAPKSRKSWSGGGA